MTIGVKPEHEFSRPVERKIWLLGGEQGSVPQSEAEIPRDSEKRVRHTGCTLFFVPRWEPILWLCHIFRFRIAEFYDMHVWTCFNLKLESHNQQSRKLYSFDKNDPEEYLARDVTITY
jgi:hypothetical protein